LKISLNKWGRLNLFISSIIEHNKEIKVILSNKQIDSRNKFQYFKTSNRQLYDSEYKKISKQGFFDVIYFNGNGELAEGAITNIFIYKNDVISTPPINAGILPGVYRKYLLKNNSSIIERKLIKEDLIEADKIILTNSVRGEVVVNKLFVNENEFISFV
jgi:para-aminobenzoate synthetase/4-amino-4-deoxychorismate lyase